MDANGRQNLKVFFGKSFVLLASPMGFGPMLSPWFVSSKLDSFRAIHCKSQAVERPGASCSRKLGRRCSPESQSTRGMFELKSARASHPTPFSSLART